MKKKVQIRRLKKLCLIPKREITINKKTTITWTKKLKNLS